MSITHMPATPLLLYSTLVGAVFLSFCILIYNATTAGSWLAEEMCLTPFATIYLLVVERLYHTLSRRFIHWMIIVFYLALACWIMLTWGLTTPGAMLILSFAIVLPSIFMENQLTLPVAGASICLIAGVQLLHGMNIVPPMLAHPSHISSIWDAAYYVTLLSIFALVLWTTGGERERSLHRALLAESKLQSQKRTLSAELENESASLRLARLDQIRHLHKFALLGQSTAATLHELSNHLSILNLDIDDLCQQHKNSKVIQNAKESIGHINAMVRQARQQLNAYDQDEIFNAITIVRRSMKDLREKFNRSHVALHKPTLSGNGSFKIYGSSVALTHIIAILLNNALDASHGTPRAKVAIAIAHTAHQLSITIMDSGKGMSTTTSRGLFQPITSTKKTGLGVGLYIAHHLAKDQFGGTIEYSPMASGSRFSVIIPTASTTPPE